MSKTPKVRTCAYCGARVPKCRREHPVPQCLWGDDPLPPQTITVPACPACDAAYSEDDGVFRTFVAARADEKYAPTLNNLITGKVARHIQQDTRLRQQMIADMVMVPVFNEMGLFIGMKPTFRTEVRRIEKIGGKIVRGLYYFDIGSPLPRTHSVQVWLDPKILRDLHARKLIRSMSPPQSMGDTMFVWRRTYARENVCHSAWLLIFFRSVPIFATTVLREPSVVDHSELSHWNQPMKATNGSTTK